ncbi:MAG: hypothetical protein GWP44_13525 [Proteobacteria bacterium]|nr:hypothetical protein [Pseudomonadota bacterium]
MRGVDLSLTFKASRMNESWRRPDDHGLRRVILVVWAIIVGAGLYLNWKYLAVDFEGTLEVVRFHVQSNFWIVGSVYLLLISLRGLVFIPSTPVLLIGVVIFPPWQNYWINLIGIVLSSFIVITAIRHFGFGASLEQLRQSNSRYKKLEAQLGRFGSPIIVGWSFFPLVPTDLIVYLATLIRIRTAVILLSVLAGEAILMAIYVFGGAALLGSLIAV